MRQLLSLGSSNAVEVVVVEQTSDADFVAGWVGAQLGVGEVEVPTGGAVRHDRELCRRYFDDVTRPVDLAAPSIGTKTVARPRSYWKSSLA
jgi:hypothetical protein